MRTVNDVLNDYFIENWFVRASRAQQMLDVGCGTQPYRRHYVAKADRVFLLDAEQREAAYQGFFVLGSVAALPWADASFDVILCTEVLEHVAKPCLAAKELGRVLRPGGSLVLTVPFNHPLHEVPEDYFRFTPWGLRALFDEQFEILEIVPRGGPLARLTSTAIGIVDRFWWLLERLLSPIGYRRKGEWATLWLARGYGWLWKASRSRRVAAFVDFTATRDLLERSPLGYMCHLRRRRETR